MSRFNDDVFELVEEAPDEAEEQISASALLEFAGNAEALIKWYNSGEGAALIKWGTKGDHTRCHAIASHYMTSDEAHGFCNLRSKAATGHYSGEKEAQNQKGKISQKARQAYKRFINARLAAQIETLEEGNGERNDS